MKKIILGLAAAAVLAAPLAVAGSATAAPAPAEKTTGSVAWSFARANDTVTGTVVFNANDKTGGTLDYTNSFGETLHGVVNVGEVEVNGDTATFHGVITGGSGNYFNEGQPLKDFTAKVIDGGSSTSTGSNGDKIGISVNSTDAPVLADVTGGNLTVF